MSEPVVEAARARQVLGVCLEDALDRGGGEPERRERVGEAGVDPLSSDRGARGSCAFDRDRIARGKVGGTELDCEVVSPSTSDFEC